MKLSIKSHQEINKVFLKNLWDDEIHVKLDIDIDLKDGWYELNLPYTGVKNEINDILINDESISHLIYTGYYTDGSGKIHQPATAMWDDGGVFKIWIHTKLGIMFERIMGEISNGKFGSILFDDYMLTVDKPVKLKDLCTESVRTFFGQGDGPHWWNKKSDHLPYKVIKNIDISKDDILAECQQICKYTDRFFYGKITINSIRENCQPKLPFYDLDSDKCPNLKKLIDHVGFKGILDIDSQTLEPNSCIRMHIDDVNSNWDADVLPYIGPCKTFYWLLSNNSDFFFKIGKGGLLPLDRPLLINNMKHVHSVVNQKTEPCKILSIYGELPDDK